MISPFIFISINKEQRSRFKRLLIWLMIAVLFVSNPGSIAFAKDSIDAAENIINDKKPGPKDALDNVRLIPEIDFPEPDFSKSSDGSSATLYPERIVNIEKSSFLVDEDVVFKVKNVRNEDEVNAVLVNNKGEKVDVAIAEEFDDTTKTFTVHAYQKLAPGEYEIEVKNNSGKTILTQDFSWGVLAFNTNKSIFSPGEQGKISIAVLDEVGSMVCDARVMLKIYDPDGRETTLSTKDKSIIVNQECNLKDFTLNPDYETAYTTSVEGVYFAKLTAATESGEYTITDTFEVRDSIPYDIERITATRIYPVKNYPVVLKIKANEGFKGNITEVVPDSFKVAELNEFRGEEVTSYDSEERIDNGKKLIWEDVEMDAGEEMMLGYEHDAPDVSPEFYLLGPLKMHGLTGSFEEVRRWQIAADDTTTAKYAGTGADSGADWTNPSNATGDTTSTAATIGLTGNGTISSNLILTNFGFTTADVPSGSTINGVTVEVEWQAGATNIVDNNVQLTTNGTSGTGTSQALGTTQGTKGFRTYGGASNTWGVSPTAAQVVSSNFGVVLNYRKTSGGGATTTSVFRVRMTITYTPPAPTVAGTVYLENESTAATTGNGGFCNGSTQNLSLRVNGGTATTTSCSGSDGAFTFTLGSAINAGDTVTIYSTASQKANRVYVSDGTPDTGQDLYINTLIVADDNDGTLSILDTLDYDNTHNATDMLFDGVDTTTDTLTTDDGVELHVWSLDTFAPGGTVTTSPSSSDSSNDGDLHLHALGALSMGSNALSIGGDFINSGTISKNSDQITTFTATSTGHGITGLNGNFANVVFNGSGGGWAYDENGTIEGDLTMTAGTLSGTVNITVSGGDVTGNGDINITGGTFTVSGGGNFGGNTAWDFANLTFSGSGTTTAAGTGSVGVSGVMTISSGHTLDGGSKTWSLTGSGTPFVNEGTFTPNASKISYDGTSGATVAGATYYDLEFNPASGTPTYTLGHAATASGGNTLFNDNNQAKIDDAGDPGAMPGVGRQVVRTSSGTLYAFINDGGSCEIWKSSDGSSWTEQDSGNKPSCAIGSPNVSIAIDDTDTIHMFYYNAGTIYQTFSTGTDTYSGSEEVLTNACINGTVINIFDIALDSSNAPHVVWWCAGDTNTLTYSNRIGGSWGNVIIGVSAISYATITLNEDDIPEIAFIDGTDSDLRVAVGDDNDPDTAGQWTLQDVDTNVVTTAGVAGTSIGVDSDGNTYVAYVDETGTNDYVSLVKHNDGDPWTTWQTPANSGSTGSEPSIAISGTDVFVFYENSADDIVYNVFDGTYWRGETLIAAGTFQYAKAKWSYLNNNEGDVQIDLLYSDATDIYYRSMTFAGLTLGSKTGFGNVSGAFYDNVNFSVASQEGSPLAVEFSPDGTKMYTTGFSDLVYEYTLGSPWNVSSAVYSGNSFNMGAQDGSPTSIRFKPDGTRMYMMGQSHAIHEYTLGTAWNVTTASFSDTFTLSGTASTQGLFIKPDGTKLYVIEPSLDDVVQISMSAWDLTTASEDGVTFDVSAQDASSQGVAFKPDGTKMYVIGDDDEVYQYSLGTAWAVNTAVYDNVFFAVGTQDTFSEDIYVNPDGTKFYIVGDSNNIVSQYTMPSTNVKIDDAGDPGAMVNTGRQVVRTSNGTLYAVINDGGNIEMWKSTDGSNWTQPDTTSIAATSGDVHIAMDSSDVIHVAYRNSGNVLYRTYSNDTWSSSETALNLISGSYDIAVDSLNTAHIVGEVTGGGLRYAHNDGGSFSTVVWEGFNTYSDISMAFNEDDVLEISYIDVTASDLSVAVANQRLATNFTIQDVDTDVNITAGTRGTSIAVDSSGNTWVAYADATGTNQITLVKHNDADAWTTWQTPVTNLNVGNEPSIAINGADVYVFYEDDLDDIVFDKYDGSVWSGESVIATGTFQDVKAKWAFLNDNGGDTQIDFMYSDGTDIYYNNLAFVDSGNGGTITTNNDFVITGSGTPTVDANTNDPAIDVDGDFTISSGTFSASDIGTFTIAGNFTNNGTFTANDGTVTFDTTGTSQLAYSGNTTFAGLNISTAGKSVQFDESQQTIVSSSLTIQGTDCTTGRIFLDSVTNDNQWDIVVTGATVDVDYADIEDSSAVTTAITANNSTDDNNNNTNWTINGGECGGDGGQTLTSGSQNITIQGGVNFRRGVRIGN